MFLEADAERIPAVLAEWRDLRVSGGPVQPDRLRLARTGLKPQHRKAARARPSFECRKQLTGDSPAPAVRNDKHSFDFTNSRLELSERAATHTALADASDKKRELRIFNVLGTEAIYRTAGIAAT